MARFTRILSEGDIIMLCIWKNRPNLLQPIVWMGHNTVLQYKMVPKALEQIPMTNRAQTLDIAMALLCCTPFYTI